MRGLGSGLSGPLASWVADRWEKTVTAVSGEWMLTKSSRRSNGGAIVLARALWASGIVYILLLALHELLDPTKSWVPSWGAARTVILRTLPWFGGIFAATYFALYARFSSQWMYLAGVYNQIKAAEIRMKERGPPDSAAQEALTEWKAGFVEDAHNLHLVGKPIFASVILEWTRDSSVREAFHEYCSEDPAILDGILEVAGAACPGHPSHRERIASTTGGAPPNESGLKQG